MIKFLIFFSFNAIILSSLYKPPVEIENYVISQLTKIHNHVIIPSIPKKSIKNIKLTVVIPVYNGEKYIEDCVTSIQMQTMKEIEIFLVNDASTDKSLKIMKNLKKKDKRIKIKNNKKNKGILYNRMYGATKSKGEYVLFIDVDDMYINPNLFEEAYNTAKAYNVEFLQFKYFGGNYTEGKGYSNYVVFSSPFQEKEGIIINQPEILNNYFYTKNKNTLLSGIVYDKLYSKKLISKMSEFMTEDFWNENLIYFEDYIIGFAAAKMADTFIIMKGMGGIWHWFNNPEGMTGHFEREDKKLIDYNLASKKMGDHIRVIEKVFELSYYDENSAIFIGNSISFLSNEDKIVHVMALCSQFENYIKLVIKYFKWKYVEEYFAAKFFNVIKNSLIFRDEKTLIKKYQFFIENEYSSKLIRQLDRKKRLDL